jgi:hypothetical protein
VNEVNRQEQIGREEALLNRQIREYNEGMDGEKEWMADKRDGVKVRIWQTLEDKTEIGLYYTLKHNVRICINGSKENKREKL